MHALNLHPSQVGTPRISATHLVKQLAEQSLKHVAGSEGAIRRAFSTDPIVPELIPDPPVNLVMHLNHHN